MSAFGAKASCTNVRYAHLEQILFGCPSEPKVDGIRALKAGLRTLLRRYGFRCVTIKKARKRGPR
jgi:hypothetical protein